MSAGTGDGNDRGVRVVGGEPPDGIELLGFLGRGRLGETWMARTRRDPVAVAKRLRAAAAADGVEALRRLTAFHDPALLEVRAVEPRDGAVWMLAEHCEGVTLRRLHAVASLTTAQWLAIARALLLGVDALHRRGLVHGALHGGNVHIGVDGRVRVGDGGIAVPDPPAADLERLQGEDLSAAWSMLRAVAGPGVRRPAWPASLTALVGEPRLSARAAIAVLASVEAGEPAAADPAAAARTRSQLAALVTPLHRRSAASAPPPPPDSDPPPAAIPTPLPPPRPAPATATAATPGTWHARGPRRALAAAFVAGVSVLCAATVFGVGVLRHRPPPPTAARAPHPRPVASAPPATAAPAAPSLRTIAPLGPPSAGDVSAVTLEPLSGSCGPGASCTVTVRIELSTHPSETVGLVLEIIDRCTGARTEVEVPQVPAPASFVYVYSSTTVPLPATAATAIVALTTSPAQAASDPLLLSGDAGCAASIPPAALLQHR